MPLMKGDKKGMAALIVRKMNGSMESPDNMVRHNERMNQVATNEAGDEIDSEPGMATAAEEMMAAIKEEDKKGFMTALKSFVEMAFMKMEDNE